VLDKPLNPADLSRAGDDLRQTSGLYGFVLRISLYHQIGLALITVLLFLVSAVPLELQRRIIDDALQRGNLRSILLLAFAYVGVAIFQGGIKLAMNVFRGWISENATRRLRAIVFSALGGVNSRLPVARTGVDISIVLAEADPVGNFVGVSFSEPLLQCGILISLLSYMTYLQPWMALIALASLAPQLFYVPAMQNAVNRRATSRILSLRAISGRLNRGKSSADFVLSLSRKADWIFVLNMSIYKIKFFLNFLMNCSFHLSMGAILALGGYYVAIGKLDIGSVVACAGGLSRINDPWGDLVDWFRELRVTQAKYALIRTAELHSEGIDRRAQ
jgi:ABC-type bacteriocin/lantibiotic exporter with double-glycine peptidase domain